MAVENKVKPEYKSELRMLLMLPVDIRTLKLKCDITFHMQKKKTQLYR
jgi:hypothetical protein